MKISETIEKHMLQGLDDMRQSIDSLDLSLFYLIVERVHLVIHMGACKVKLELPLERSSEREFDVKNSIEEVSQGSIVSKTFFQSFFEGIYTYSLDIMKYMKTHQAEIYSYLETFPVREMCDYRCLLSGLDRALCNILLYRYDVVYQVGVFKKQRNLPPIAKERWQNIIERKRSLATNNNIDADFIESLFNIIHAESLRIEKLISKSQ